MRIRDHAHLGCLLCRDDFPELHQWGIIDDLATKFLDGLHGAADVPLLRGGWLVVFMADFVTKLPIFVVKKRNSDSLPRARKRGVEVAVRQLNVHHVDTIFNRLCEGTCAVPGRTPDWVPTTLAALTAPFVLSRAARIAGCNIEPSASVPTVIAAKPAAFATEEPAGVW
ncbi:hypothetical protein ACJZ2D_010287 [Fusarium nematophilum]